MNRIVQSTMALLCLILVLSASVQPQTYQLVLASGRVIDPESGLDGLRHGGRPGGLTDEPRCRRPPVRDPAAASNVSGGLRDRPLHRHRMPPPS